MLSTKYWWTRKNNLPPFNSGTSRYHVWRKFRVCFSVSLRNFGLATYLYFETIWGRDRDLRLDSYISLPNVYIPIDPVPPCIVKVDPCTRDIVVLRIEVFLSFEGSLRTKYRYFETIWGRDRDLRLYSYIILPNVHIPIERFLSLPPSLYCKSWPLHIGFLSLFEDGVGILDFKCWCLLNGYN